MALFSREWVKVGRLMTKIVSYGGSVETKPKKLILILVQETLQTRRSQFETRTTMFYVRMDSTFRCSTTSAPRTPTSNRLEPTSSDRRVRRKQRSISIKSRHSSPSSFPKLATARARSIGPRSLFVETSEILILRSSGLPDRCPICSPESKW